MRTLKIRATSKVAGELVLSSIGPLCVLKAGTEIAISEPQYWADDVQRAIAVGKVELLDGGGAITDEGLVMIRLLKQSNSLVLPSLPEPLKYGYFYEIPKRTFEKDDVQVAIRRRVIEEVTPEQYARLVQEDEGPPQQSQTFTAPTRSEVEVQPLSQSMNVATVKPEDTSHIDMEMLTPAERFAMTGKAQRLERKMSDEKGYYVFEPHKAADRQAKQNYTVLNPRGEPNRLVKAVDVPVVQDSGAPKG